MHSVGELSDLRLKSASLATYPLMRCSNRASKSLIFDFFHHFSIVHFLKNGIAPI